MEFMPFYCWCQTVFMSNIHFRNSVVRKDFWQRITTFFNYHCDSRVQWTVQKPNNWTESCWRLWWKKIPHMFEKYGWRCRNCWTSKQNRLHGVRQQPSMLRCNRHQAQCRWRAGEPKISQQRECWFLNFTVFRWVLHIVWIIIL